ncbi:GlmU family protein [Prosthecochloris vibrioformis]|nr:GlmU family protein [Prosthecochloris vibrioformis]
MNSIVAMSLQIVVYEDEAVAGLLPLTELKPVYALVTGASTLAVKFRRCLGAIGEVMFHMRSGLAAWFSRQYPVFSAPAGDELLLVNGRIVCDDSFTSLLGQLHSPGQSLVQDGELLALRVTAAQVAACAGKFDALLGACASGAATGVMQCQGVRVISHLWDPVSFHTEELHRESALLSLGCIEGDVAEGAHLVNPERIYVGKGARIGPGAVLDASEGFVAVSPGAIVEPQAVVAGNVFIAGQARVKMMARVYSNVCVGAFAKVGGEVEDSVIESYSNKQHDGFLGHSYISSWCNLGAGTTTSDLRNDYKKVKLHINGVEHATGLQFLGLIMGEHSKAAINSTFNTGTVVGTSVNMFGSGLSPGYIPSFSWGGPGTGFSTYRPDKALETARTVMARRGVELDEAYEVMFMEAASRCGKACL